MIKTEALFRRYQMGDQIIQAVQGVDLEIKTGESVALLGPSGSGKSTLMHLLGALDTPSGGQISVGGHEISKLDAASAAMYRGRNIGFVFQSFHLHPQMTALENVALPLKLAGVPKAERDQRAKELLELVGLGQRLDHKPSELSGGQQQRVSIARALSNQPSLLLADEPTGNLDSGTGKDVMDLFLRLQKERGLTLVVVTHDAEVASRLDRVIRMRDGQIESAEEGAAASKEDSGTAQDAFVVPPQSIFTKTRDLVSDVLFSIRRHPLRTSLTAFGIAVGGLAITLMVGLGYGLHDFIQTQAQSINDPLQLSVMNSDTSIQDIVGDRAQQLGKPPTPLKESTLALLTRARGGFESFSEEQIKAIKAIPGVQDVRPRTYVILDGVRLVPKGQEALDLKQAAASDKTGDTESFEKTGFFIGYSLVRGLGTKFRLATGRNFDDKDSRHVVLSYQYAEAWGLQPSELVGREIELLFPDLGKYRQFTWIIPQKVKGTFRTYRAKVIGLTRKSILSSAIFLPPKFGEEILKFQFGKVVQPTNSMDWMGRIQGLMSLANDDQLRKDLSAGSEAMQGLGKALTVVDKASQSLMKGQTQSLMPLMLQLNMMRSSAKDEELVAALEAGSDSQKRLALALKAMSSQAQGQNQRNFGSRIKVRVRSEKDLASVRAKLEEQGFRVKSLQENLAIVSKIFGVVDAFLSSFGLIALFVAALGIANTLIMAVYERTREIGLMKAIGATSQQIRALFAGEAAAIGLLGGFVGASTGWALGELFNVWGVTLIAEEWQGFRFFDAPLSLLVSTVFFCGVIGFLAGLYPAHRAASLDPIVALRVD